MDGDDDDDEEEEEPSIPKREIRNGNKEVDTKQKKNVLECEKRSRRR